MFSIIKYENLLLIFTGEENKEYIINIGNYKKQFIKAYSYMSY